MSPQSFSYINAVRAKQYAPKVGTGDLISVIRVAHWRHKRHSDLADRWQRVKDRALRDLNKTGLAERHTGQAS